MPYQIILFKKIFLFIFHNVKNISANNLTKLPIHALINNGIF